MTLSRLSVPAIEAAIMDTPVILLTGARQSGKSTLARQFSKYAWTFDDFATCQSAKENPEGFIQNLIATHPNSLCILDEVQLVPEIFRAIKKHVDQHKRPGMFILTGSANLLSWEKMPDSLVGRIEYIQLYPLSLREVAQPAMQTRDQVCDGHNWIDALFTGSALEDAFSCSVDKTIVDAFMVSGGFPEAYFRKTTDRRLRWLETYIHGMLQKDARDLGGIERPAELFKMLSLLANRCGSTLNHTDLAQLLGISRPTCIKYLMYLELLYLCHTLRPWHRNINKRLVKSPKVFLADSGLLQFFLGKDTQNAAGTAIGALVETYVFCELQKQLSFTNTRANMFFYRTAEGQEIDFILEDLRGKLIAIEVKASHSVSLKDFKWIKSFKAEVENDFIAGIVFYRGDHILSFGDKLYAVPLTYLI